MLPMLPNNFSQIAERIQRQNNRSLKELFKNDIRGSFLIDIKYRVFNAIAEKFFELYDLRWSDERMVTGIGTEPEYDICKHIVGVHKANTIFLTADEKSKIEKDENYKTKLTKQVAEQIFLRGYGSAYFRHKPIMVGERFNYYPVPYELFVLCMKMNHMIYLNGAKNESAFYFAKITNKALSALSLLEDNFLGTAYLPCRTVLELYAKLLVMRIYPELFAEDEKFSYFETLQTCCNQVFPDEFNKLFANRKNKNERNKVEYMHYGFVDKIPNYHDIVKQKPYTFRGVLNYLKANCENETLAAFEMMERLYKMCHVYVHGGVVESRYPLLHYFEISLMLSSVIPSVYEMFCEDYAEERDVFGINVLDKIEADYILLCEQYEKRSTENFEMKN